jgi:hypothetical protein
MSTNTRYSDIANISVHLCLSVFIKDSALNPDEPVMDTDEHGWTQMNADGHGWSVV